MTENTRSKPDTKNTVSRLCYETSVSAGMHVNIGQWYC